MAKINPIDVQKDLKGVDYPVGKADLAQRVWNGDSTDEVRSAIEQLPDQRFHTPADVSQALGTID
ncbi:MAG: hypothetical protein NVS2B16_04960 [Chloroflexota bacterium]